MRQATRLGTIAGLAAAALASSGGAAVAAQEPVTKTVPMRWVGEARAPTPLTPAREVEGSSQTTIATADGAAMQVVTTGLEPGHAYTLWFVFFNRPEYCVDMPTPELNCGLADLFNPLADGSVVYGSGLVASGATETFDAYRPVGEAPAGDPEEKMAWGGGVLTNPRGAEYQSIVRNHGPADPDYMPEQLETFNGGCGEGEPYQCTDDQASGFRTELPVR